jgi:hypothetical protein
MRRDLSVDTDKEQDMLGVAFAVLMMRQKSRTLTIVATVHGAPTGHWGRVHSEPRAAAVHWAMSRHDHPWRDAAVHTC